MPRIQLPNGGWRPRPYQQAMWDHLERGGLRAIGAWHRRAGKDEVLLHRTAVAAFERPATYWTALPEYAQARKALWAAVNPHSGKRRIDEAFPHELRTSTNEQEMFIRFHNGSTWQLVGSDRYNSLVGAGVAGVTFSEFALANPSAWGYIRPMLEENNGWAAFISTPRGRNHFKSLLDMAKANPKWFAETLSVHDTGALSADQIEESLREYCALYGEDMGRAQFAQEYEVSFNAAILGAFYAREMHAVRTENRVQPIQPIPGRPVHRAWDIGVRDDTSIWWFQVVGPRIYILDCYTASGVGVDHYAEVVQQRREQHGWIDGNDYVPHDAKVKEWGTGRTRVETMTSLGLKPVLVPLACKMDGIQAARTTLARCLFHPRTEDVGISAMEQYRREWDDEKKCFKANEVHDWTSNLADAFRYLAMSWRLVPVHIDVSLPTPKPGQTILPPPPPEGNGVGKRMRL
jgi:phage terminase large subunit